jgi:hypothetical protein
MSICVIDLISAAQQDWAVPENPVNVGFIACNMPLAAPTHTLTLQMPPNPLNQGVFLAVIPSHP